MLDRCINIIWFDFGGFYSLVCLCVGLFVCVDVVLFCCSIFVQLGCCLRFLLVKMMGMGKPPPMSKRMFDKFDKDKSNSITYDEFKALVADLGYHLSDDELKIATALLDKVWWLWFG